jgi:hypothetical protein
MPSCTILHVTNRKCRHNMPSANVNYAPVDHLVCNNWLQDALPSTLACALHAPTSLSSVCPNSRLQPCYTASIDEQHHQHHHLTEQPGSGSGACQRLCW